MENGDKIGNDRKTASRKKVLTNGVEGRIISTVVASEAPWAGERQRAILENDIEKNEKETVRFRNE